MRFSLDSDDMHSIIGDAKSQTGCYIIDFFIHYNSKFMLLDKIFEPY